MVGKLRVEKNIYNRCLRELSYTSNRAFCFNVCQFTILQLTLEGFGNYKHRTHVLRLLEEGYFCLYTLRSAILKCGATKYSAITHMHAHTHTQTFVANSLSLQLLLYCLSSEITAL